MNLISYLIQSDHGGGKLRFQYTRVAARIRQEKPPAYPTRDIHLSQLRPILSLLCIAALFSAIGSAEPTRSASLVFPDDAPSSPAPDSSTHTPKLVIGDFRNKKKIK